MRGQTGERRVLFDVPRDGAKMAPKVVAPEAEQDPYESGRLWANLTKAIGARDMEAAQEAKSAVEERERELRKTREERGEVFRPRFFEQRNGRWEPKIQYMQCVRTPVVSACELTLCVDCRRTQLRPLPLSRRTCGPSRPLSRRGACESTLCRRWTGAATMYDVYYEASARYTRYTKSSHGTTGSGRNQSSSSGYTW
jgi:hypothetical protein